MAKGNPPKYWLKITDKKNTKNRARAGVAFENEYGQLNIVLNPGVVLNWSDEVFITLNLFTDEYPASATGALPTTKRKEEEDKDDGDIPF